MTRRESATPFMGLVAAFHSLLREWSAQEDIVTGIDMANRMQREWEDVAGLFVNVLVVRTRVPAKSSFHDVLRQVRSASLGAFANQQAPFDRLISELRPKRSASYQPIFQVLIVLQNAPEARLELSGLSVREVALDRPNPTAKFDLLLSLTEKDARIEASIEYNMDLFDEATIVRLAEDYIRILRLAAQDCQSPIHLPNRSVSQPASAAS
jgi:non-ribosomal peptide synthetase component F